VFKLGFFALCVSLSLCAQSVRGQIEDATGATLPAVEVTLSSVERGQSTRALSDTHGAYQFLTVPIGTYNVIVRDLRFRPMTRRIQVAVGDELDVPLRLILAGDSSSITVAADAPILDTARTSISGLVLRQEIDAMPLNGRNYLDLALLVPGVSRTNTGVPQQFAETSAVPGTGLSFASQRNLNNNFVLDGLSLNDDAAGLTGTYLSQEVIREFQAVQAGSTAEFGRASSGVVNLSSQTGTNAWHGRAYGFLRNQRLDARNPLATSKDPLTQTQYGASLGGPLRKDRTFLFSNFEQTRRHAAGFVTIAPANVAAINRVLDRLQSPAARVSTGQYSTGWHMTSFFARADHELSSTQKLFGRYALYDIASPNARTVGGLNDISRATRLDNRDQSLAGAWTSLIGPRTVNELRLQFSRGQLSAPGNDVTGPAVNIAGVANFGASTSSPVGRNNDLFELADSFSVTRAGHTLRLGGSLLHNKLSIYFPGSQIAAVYAFSNLANFEAGRYQTFQQSFGDPNQDQTNPNFATFAQDEWRVHRRLTVQMGVRYDVQKLTSPVRTDRNNIAPRIGIAWTADRSTVVRLGYGLFYDRILLRALSNALQRDGTKYRTALLSFGQAGAPAFPFQATAFPSGLFINITTIDPAIQNSYAQQANLQVERRLGDWELTAGYQWLRGLHLILSRNANVPTLTAAQATAQGVANLGRPDSRYGNVARYEGAGDSYYHGASATAHYRHGNTSLRISYTFSRAIDNVGNFFFSSPQNNFNLRDDRGLSDNDQRHRITATTTWAWRGWQLSPILVYTSPLPFNLQLGQDRNFDTNTNDRPLGVGRNTGRGFDYVSFDARLQRTLRLSERFHLEVLTEVFNALNRTNRAVPNAVVTSPVFGQATAVFDARQIQLGLRLNF
jgi:hypothetical protein